MRLSVAIISPPHIPPALTKIQEMSVHFGKISALSIMAWWEDIQRRKTLGLDAVNQITSHIYTTSKSKVESFYCIIVTAQRSLRNSGYPNISCPRWLLWWCRLDMSLIWMWRRDTHQVWFLILEIPKFLFADMHNLFTFNFLLYNLSARFRITTVTNFDVIKLHYFLSTSLASSDLSHTVLLRHFFLIIVRWSAHALFIYLSRYLARRWSEYSEQCLPC